MKGILVELATDMKEENQGEPRTLQCLDHVMGHGVSNMIPWWNHFYLLILHQNINKQTKKKGKISRGRSKMF